MNNNFSQKVKDMISKLESSSYKELLDDISLSDIKDSFSSLTEGLERLESEDKTLTIAIVGQVKAGKSSFLNALFFEGEDILPKAVTPMTAALTKIRYSEKNYAKVHFFNNTDWDNIKEGAKKAKNLIDQKREEMNAKLREKNREPVNKSDMELLKSMDNVSESNKAFFEMYELFNKNAARLESKINSSEKDNFEILDNISSANDLKNRLEDYVGANGAYTAIVKYVELFLNIDAIKDFDIVDTPGLNDPVISRGNLTRTFLSKCDAVFLLSQSSQFFDSQDVSLFTEHLPENGIREVFVIGSKFDNGLIGEAKKYNEDINVAVSAISSKLDSQYRGLIGKYMTKDDDRKKSLENAKTYLISSMCYNIAKHYDNLSEEEEHTKKQLQRAYPKADLSKDGLMELANIDVFNKEVIPSLVARAEKIFQDKINDLVLGKRKSIDNALNSLIDNINMRYNEFINADIGTLNEKLKKNLSVVSKLKGRIEDIYDSKIHEVKVKFYDLINEIDDLANDFANVQERTRTEQHTVTVKKRGILSGIARFLGIGGTEEQTRTRNISYASTHDAIENVNQALKKSRTLINETCKNIIDHETFPVEIIQSVSGVFDLGDKDFDVDDIIYPLKKVLRGISLPNIDISKDYAEDVISAVSGKSETSVSELQNALRRVLSSIVRDMGNIIRSRSSEITSKLDSEAGTLIEKLTNNIKEESEKLRKELENKEKYKSLYENAIEDLNNIKNSYLS
ncbi:dynamin family protein [uncultured Brachyspira sp.]|uniref:dynamin family protein n=1 Tax=uncultured Brachyspira sp. TaxID=221953 RepID=UPI0026099D6B|nr:dynamin family protein [uncultured Brachyspira sp.]